MAKVGVCTRPKESNPLFPAAKVMACVALIPMSQSDSERERADMYRLSYSVPAFKLANPSLMALSVWLDIQRRLKGTLEPKK
ncbi:hypothetical protein D3C81_1578210 [compost metagenome]